MGGSASGSGSVVVEPGDDGGVVGGGVGERLAGPGAGGSPSPSAPLGPQLGEHAPVVGGVDDDADVGVVLGRGPHHGRAADVDHLDARLAR